MDNPTVFVSYSHDNDEHKSWVLKLASDLRSHGVNAIPTSGSLWRTVFPLQTLYYVFAQNPMLRK